MGIFTRKNGDAQKASSKVRSVLTKAVHERDGLRGRLPELRAELSLATDERRGLLTAESLNDANVSRDRINAARDRLEDVEYLLGECDKKIATLEIDLQSALDGERVEAAIGELLPHVQQLEQGIALLATAAKALTGPAREVALRVRFANTRFSTDLGDLLGAIGQELSGVVANANQHIEQLRNGSARVLAPLPETPLAPAPAPAGPRTEVLLVSDSCWVENGETVSAARWSIKSIPTEVALRAEKLGWCFRREHPMVTQLLDSLQVSSSGPYHYVDPRDCVDLSSVNSRPPGSVEAAPSLPPGAVEHIGNEIVGTASASPVP